MEPANKKDSEMEKTASDVDAVNEEVHEKDCACCKSKKKDDAAGDDETDEEGEDGSDWEDNDEKKVECNETNCGLLQKLMTFEVDDDALAEPADLASFTDMDTLFKEYEMFARQAIAIMICHHDTLIDATQMKLSEQNENNDEVAPAALAFNEEDARVLDETCHKYMQNVSPVDRAKRAVLMGALVDLMVYDLAKENEGVSLDDFEQCIMDFMLEHYNLEDDPEGVQVIAANCLTIREEFTATAEATASLWSAEFQRLKLMNEHYMKKI